MNNIKGVIIYEFNNKQYNKCIDIINNYVNSGFGVDNQIIFYYVKSLIELRKFDNAYEIIKWLEKTTKDNIDCELYHLYFYCFKPNDALRIINKMDYSKINKTILIKLYLMQGKIKEAKIILNETLKTKSHPSLLHLRNVINNYEIHGAFIEMDYESFINNENSLEVGHIVYLKNNPNSLENITDDYKCNRRPYMIWKCENDKIYLFPLTTNTKTGFYVLFKQKYPNSDCDRIVKDTLCYTTKDNILSVCDRLRKEDIKPVLETIYRRIYLRKSKKAREFNSDFIKEYLDEIEINDIIVIYDRNNHKKNYKYVYKVNKDNYLVLNIDNNFNVLNNSLEEFNKDRIIFKIIKPSNEDIEKIKKQLPLYLLLNTLIGAKIIVDDRKYIVIDENDRECLCLYDIYSPSYMNIICIKKEEIKDIIDFISEDTYNNLKEMVTNDADNYSKSLIKKFKKNK